MNRIAGVFCLLVVLAVALAASDPNARTPSVLVDITNRQGFNGVLVLSAALLILSGSIDLSLGSVVALSGVAFADLIARGYHPYLALALTLALGGLIGLVQGSLVQGLKLQSFLVTLCGMFVFRGLARLLGGGQEIGLVKMLKGQPPGFKDALDSMQWALIGRDPVAEELEFPGMMAWLLVLAALAAAVLHGTVHGRYWFALGYSETASRYAGVPVARYRVASFVIASTLGAFGGVLFLLNNRGLRADSDAVGLELEAITGAVLGGVSLRGGEGVVPGMVLGACVFPLVRSLMTFRSVPNDAIPLVVGLTLFAGAVVDEFLRRRGPRRRS